MSIKKAASRVGIILAVAVTIVVGRTNVGSFTDPRDGRVYHTVGIVNTMWMAENLNFKTGESWCYSNNETNCEIYGRLYDWETAKGACPNGWHLPSREEWKGLMAAVGGEQRMFEQDLEFMTSYAKSGKKLKSVRGWRDHVGGNNKYGFSALPGGTRDYDKGDFDSFETTGYWWSATGYGGSGAYLWFIHNDITTEIPFNKKLGSSVRCALD